MTRKMVRKIAVLSNSTEYFCHWVPCKSDDSMTPKTVLELNPAVVSWCLKGLLRSFRNGC